MIKVEFREGKEWSPVLDVLLSQGDSTSAAGWLAKSSFNDNCPLHLTIARAFADFCLTHEIDHYTQWFPGRENKVADILSRDFALDDDEVTLLIKNYGSAPFVPQNFKIIPLQPALISQIGDWLRPLLPKTQLLPTQPAPSTAAAGAATSDSSSELESLSTLFSSDSDEAKEEKSSRVLPPPFGTDGFAFDSLRQMAMEPCPKKYADDDPGLAQQQAIPLEVIRKVRSWARNELDVAVGQLVVTAFFFAMRSCEYSDVGSGRRTSVVRVNDVRFRKLGDEALTTSSLEKNRADADAVTITFRRQQKNGDNGATVTQHRNNNPDQADICPVRTLAELLHRVKGNEQEPGRANLKINVRHVRIKRDQAHLFKNDPWTAQDRDEIDRRG